MNSLIIRSWRKPLNTKATPLLVSTSTKVFGIDFRYTLSSTCWPWFVLKILYLKLGSSLPPLNRSSQARKQPRPSAPSPFQTSPHLKRLQGIFTFNSFGSKYATWNTNFLFYPLCLSCLSSGVSRRASLFLISLSWLFVIFLSAAKWSSRGSDQATSRDSKNFFNKHPSHLYNLPVLRHWRCWPSTTLRYSLDASDRCPGKQVNLPSWVDLELDLALSATARGGRVTTTSIYFPLASTFLALTTSRYLHEPSYVFYESEILNAEALRSYLPA